MWLLKKINIIKGGISAGLLANVWIPLNFPAPIEQSSSNIIPDITISNIFELKSLLIVDEPTPQPPPLSSSATTLLQSSGGNARSLKLKASRSNGPLTTLSASSSSTTATSSSSTSMQNVASTGCFSSAKIKSAAPYPKRFLPLSPPDLENDASNASDGSWFLNSFHLFAKLTRSIQFVLFDGIL